MGLHEDWKENALCLSITKHNPSHVSGDECSSLSNSNLPTRKAS